MMKKAYDRNTLIGVAALLRASVIWGSTFVAQSMGMDHVGPFTFNALRSIVASAAIGGSVLLFNLVRRIRGTYTATEKHEKRFLWLGGLCCGLAYFCAATLQQVGMQETTVGKAGFLTALYIIEVPLVGIFLKKKVRPIIWGCVVIAVVGMYLLCIGGGEGSDLRTLLSFSRGDLLVFLCSLAFTGHILAIDYFASRANPVKLCALQFLVAGVLSVPPMFLFEVPTVSAIGAAAGAVLYAALLSSGIAYTLQIVGQKLLQPAHASLLMSLESVFSLLSGVVVLHQIPTVREGIGCAFMFLAIVLAQLPERKVPAER